ncbi:MAG TPA: hypothetical protein H9741_03725 [Candidatus Borkfalkia faecipullorum]|uniref:Ferritin-like diiron domain-containing protein n=1 Tax=Candidatus Borkfalkia faecipullorum TaxID=2838510 RepID=A0A9D2AG17_9FIRM|nr:hypothetical protein [Candidatus Borkfalkia faecipullorum]
MQFNKTMTYTNLARSFAGESQAGMRYQLIAKLAIAEEYPVLADNIRTIAKNETNHAKTFFDTLVLKAGSRDNIDIDAGYPFQFGTLVENLKFAADGEKAEHEEVYPAFAAQAREEGFEDIAALFERVAGVEREHEIVFRYLHNALKDGVLYKRNKPTLWVCSECGYRATTKEAWKLCPLCKATQGYVEIPLPFDQA